jgi:hypothetical protein
MALLRRSALDFGSQPGATTRRSVGEILFGRCSSRLRRSWWRSRRRRKRPAPKGGVSFRLPGLIGSLAAVPVTPGLGSPLTKEKAETRASDTEEGSPHTTPRATAAPCAEARGGARRLCLARGEQGKCRALGSFLSSPRLPYRPGCRCRRRSRDNPRRRRQTAYPRHSRPIRVSLPAPPSMRSLPNSPKT